MDQNAVSWRTDWTYIHRRKIWKSILLSFLTLGIYTLYWKYLLAKNVRAIREDDGPGVFREMLCLIFVPFYNVYWWVTRCQAVSSAFARLELPAKDLRIPCLLLSLLGMEPVAAAILQEEFNSLSAAAFPEPVPRRRERAGRTFSWVYFGLIIAFLYAPIVIMIVFSFNSGRNVTVWEGFSFENYLSLLQKHKAIESLWNSLLIALLSSLGSCVLGTLASLGLNNLKKSRGLVMNVSNLPIINPEIVTGVSLMLIFVFLFSWNMGLGFHTVLIAHIVFNTPYVILNVLPRLRRMDKNLYEAALDLGCTPTQGLWKVVMPELFPAILSGFLISFTYSMDDFIISYYTGGTFQTFSVFIYNSLKKGPQDWMLALSGLLFVAVLMVLIVMNVHDIRQEKRERAKG